MKPRGVTRLTEAFVSLFRDRPVDDFAVVTPERRHIVFEV
jgi:hypothetical protein